MTSPVAAWGLREGSGTVAVDATGNGHNLDVAGDWVPGGGISAIGTGVGATGDFAAPFTTGFAINGWFDPSALPSGGTQAAVGFYDGVGNSEILLWLQRGDFGTPNVVQANLRTGSLHELTDGAMTVDVEEFLGIEWDGTTLSLYRGTTAEEVALVTSTEITGELHSSEQFAICGGPSGSGASSDVAGRDVRIYAAPIGLTAMQADAATPVSSGVEPVEVAPTAASTSSAAAAVSSTRSTTPAASTVADAAAQIATARAAAPAASTHPTGTVDVATARTAGSVSASSTAASSAAVTSSRTRSTTSSSSSAAGAVVSTTRVVEVPAATRAAAAAVVEGQQGVEVAPAARTIARASALVSTTRVVAPIAASRASATAELGEFPLPVFAATLAAQRPYAGRVTADRPFTSTLGEQHPS